MKKSSIESDKKSLKWAQDLAYRKDDPFWWSNLAAYYATGTGCRPNLFRSRQWYSKAARAKDPTGMFELGCMFLQGEGGPKNVRRAKQLLTAAAQAGEIGAVTVLQHCYKKGVCGFMRSKRQAAYYQRLYNKLRKALAYNKVLFLIITALSLLPFFGCSRPSRTAPIINEYRAAVCILPLGYAKHSQPPTLEWDQTLARDGTAIQIHGLEAPGTRIFVKYSRSGAEIGVTEMVDYVYPSDIRIDNNREILYVKTDGYVAGWTQRTCLIAFDLNKRAAIVREEVDKSVLPPECPNPKTENSKP